MNRPLILIACLSILALAGLYHQPPRPSAPLNLSIPDLEARLSALSPDNPAAYLLLAEELAAEAPADRPARDLARTLYVLAFDLHLNRSQPADGEHARSACLGLASLTTNQSQRRWLAAVGDLAAPPTEKALTAVARLPAPITDSVALNLATAMGLARAGEGRRAETFLNRPGVQDLLNSAEAVIAGGRTAGSPSVLKWVQDWPACPTCKNRRFTTRGNQPSICQYCDGNPGPKLSEQELTAQYRAESLLLRGVYRSWSAQLLADEGEPLRDPNPRDVAPLFGVDPRATLWRSGAWTAP